MMRKVRLASIVFLSAVFLSGCYDNVSNRVSVVKSDLKAAISMGAVAPDEGSELVFAKADVVSDSVGYSGDRAKHILQNVNQIAHALGYETLATEKRQQKVFCHKSEKARMLWIEVVNELPLQVSIGVKISGRGTDAKVCIGSVAS